MAVEEGNASVVMSEAEDNTQSGITPAQRDALHAALHERLVQTGEYHRIMSTLRATLDEQGWTASVRQQAQQLASQQSPGLSLPNLVDSLTPFAEKTIPSSVRDNITAQLLDFVSRNVEDA